MNKIRGRKGFTLVECIIAVAVFGLLSLVIFMILMNASARAGMASSAEENLAQLIENVVGDDTYKKYDSGDAKAINLTIDTIGGTAYSGADKSDFKVSYAVISGYKNYIECNPTGSDVSCGRQANFTEFMYQAGSTTVTVSSADFDQDHDHFVCPDCQKEQQNIRLKCPDCDATGHYKETIAGSTNKKFRYMNETTGGGFECQSCGSTAVMAVDSSGNFISEKVSADGLAVSGIVPNGIRYGEDIQWNLKTTDPLYAGSHADNLANDRLCYYRKINTTDPSIPGAQVQLGKIRVSIQYTGTDNASSPGTYTMNLTPLSLPGEVDSTNYQMDIVLPKGYTAVLQTGTPADVAVVEGKLPGDSSGKIYPMIRVTNSGATSVTDIKFTLVSKETGYPFEYDYNKNTGEADTNQGLFRWFGMTPTVVTRNSAGYLKSARGDKDVLNN